MCGDKPLTVEQKRKKVLSDTPSYKTREQIRILCDKPAKVCNGNCKIFKR